MYYTCPALTIDNLQLDVNSLKWKVKICTLISAQEVMFSGLSVHSSITYQDYAKTNRLIFMKLGAAVLHEPT